VAIAADLPPLSSLWGEPARAEMGVALRGDQALSAGELAWTVRLSEGAHLSPVFRVDIADETPA
jgi:hypothetical protein